MCTLLWDSNLNTKFVFLFEVLIYNNHYESYYMHNIRLILFLLRHLQCNKFYTKTEEFFNTNT